MEFTGRLILDLPMESGTSKAGNPWKKKSWVLEIPGQYPKKVKVDAFGNNADSIQMEPGKDYTVSVDLESREFNGRWYTDVRVYRSVPAGSQTAQGGTESAVPNDPFKDLPGGFPPAPEAPSTPFADNSDDLPF